MRKREILLNAFNMNCVSHINHGLWTHPRDRSGDYRHLSYWTELARTLERGLFDGLFLADIVGVYDVYRNDVDVTLRESIQLPVNDPTLLVPAMAAVTRHLGFGVTVNLSYEAPYLLARRFSTLDHLSDGRIGWNIVTGYLDSAARAMGVDTQLPHDERYERADEYMALLYKLWEGSWDDDAVRRDKTARVYADPARVHRVRHTGRYYRADGYHLSEPSPQRTPVLFQAGSSGRGQRFAAEHAECVFISPPDKAAARKTVQALHEALRRVGRAPEDVKVFVGIAVVPGATPAEARAKYDDYRQYASREAGLAHFAASTGVDYAQYDLDEPIDYSGGNAIQSASRTAAERGWTRRSLLEMFGFGGRYPAIVGDPAQVADELESWLDETGIDGFNLSRTVVPESYEDFVDLVIPELQHRGRYKTAYAPGTLRQRLFGQGDRLPERHGAARYRSRIEVAA
ncbi:LLM class flavin-dependent oxidoreductase [Chitinasiproducens palmae]|uniref:FMN-dependent oxidoreductase, nitrilotriacetate monooxygenase family n=1 Tax=Chitinasiproducens palmae TaxID=1770053 RepID=A0A1H2PQA1_9BURK|nr:LLM class flavin-dependent oxidoreductase [Chitinasiproducens palmae]SDV49001.1 FMN-dependent oxidoreductase, nitrilotriacetate monooxygenase family [Chitinasiproducens palmae]